jgi:hypothetical protein
MLGPLDEKEATTGAKVFSNSFVLNIVAVGVLQID